MPGRDTHWTAEISNYEKKNSAFIFYLEAGGSTFLRNVGSHLPVFSQS
jgi:hypothetical protein